MVECWDEFLEDENLGGTGGSASNKPKV